MIQFRIFAPQNKNRSLQKISEHPCYTYIQNTTRPTNSIQKTHDFHFLFTNFCTNFIRLVLACHNKETSKEKIILMRNNNNNRLFQQQPPSIACQSSLPSLYLRNEYIVARYVRKAFRYVNYFLLSIHFHTYTEKIQLN